MASEQKQQDDGPIMRFLGNLEIDADKGAAFSANRQWEHAFQVSEEEQRNRIVRGKYGLDLVCAFLEFFAVQKGIKGTEHIGMLARRLHGLNKLLDSIPGLTSDVVMPPSQFFAPRPRKPVPPDGAASLVPAKVATRILCDSISLCLDADADDDAGDKSYRLRMNVDMPSEEDSDAPEEITQPEKSKGKDKGKEKQTKQTVSLEPPPKKQKLKSRQLRQ
ncbi:hypothetical protein B0H10DRAFT_2227626 [Mycena sp. CBHHK59/15]|nr:hypothetical protein B0H10DRAFT_2227626 [Mycena sp. CBHHK59/15]